MPAGPAERAVQYERNDSAGYDRPLGASEGTGSPLVLILRTLWHYGAHPCAWPATAHATTHWRPT
eukprot:3869426-Pyramimonas_sp.AAC.1